jgi:hypothetical protein
MGRGYVFGAPAPYAEGFCDWGWSGGPRSSANPADGARDPLAGRPGTRGAAAAGGGDRSVRG